ncbi:MAG: 2-isopropylmalate synthase [Succinivibrionaceae bacterium]|nr:2-isopropylmalate synthase [Succinivibrionaceae bacterium]
MSDQVLIFDTSLRDGEQALAASLSAKEKLQIALTLEQLGVDIMEVGFPISSSGDFDSVKQIAGVIKNSTVCGLARVLEKDIDAAYEALKDAERYRIHCFIATSDVHVKDKLHKDFDSIVEMAVRGIKYARNKAADVEFSCEDAGRTPIDHLCRIVEAAIDAGAQTINIPDTVGYTLPSEFGGIIANLFNRVPNIDKARISVHCHNDLGMATANSLSAVLNGARQIECTVNGIGERAGNCSLEEVVMAMKTRSSYMNVYTNINHKEIAHASQIVSQICNMPVPANKAIVGSNAFSHSSGIHQDGVLKNKDTYEIITPESVGFNNNNLNLTARSGRHVIAHRLSLLGYKEDSYNLDEIYKKFKELADLKGQVFDYDLEALLFFSKIQDEPVQFKLQYLSVISGGVNIMPTASMKMSIGEKIVSDAATGNGPVDAVYQCIYRLTGYNDDIKLVKYDIKSKGQGKDALGQVDIIVDYKGKIFHGMGLSTDIIQSSALAMIHACNSIYRSNLIAEEKKKNPDHHEFIDSNDKHICNKP